MVFDLEISGNLIFRSQSAAGQFESPVALAAMEMVVVLSVRQFIYNALGREAHPGKPSLLDHASEVAVDRSRVHRPDLLAGKLQYLIYRQGSLCFGERRIDGVALWSMPHPGHGALPYRTRFLLQINLQQKTARFFPVKTRLISKGGVCSFPDSFRFGEVSEWFKEHAWKACVR
jgi:hypothetical protein